MSNISLFETIQYQGPTYGWWTTLQNFVEDCSSLNKNIVQINPDGITARYEKSENSSCIKTALKMTVIMPAIFFALKVCLRFFSSTYLWFEKKNILKQNVLPHSNQAVKALLHQIIDFKNFQIFWIPHPEFHEEDIQCLPITKVPILGVYKVAELAKYFPHWLESGQKFEGNAFFQWLNPSGNNELIDFDSSKEVFMNCADFVFLVLHKSGLINKKDILQKYQSEIERQINGQLDTYYGFHLDLFKSFDPKKGNGEENPKPGDLLIGFEEDRPVHILFLAGKNIESGTWKGLGLWNMGTEKPVPSNLDLTELQNDYVKYNSGKPLSFKYCPLEKVI